MKMHTEVTAESGISRGKCATETLCALVEMGGELPPLAPPYNHTKLLRTVFFSSRVLRAEVNCICQHLQALSERRSVYGVLYKPEGEAAWNSPPRLRDRPSTQTTATEVSSWIQGRSHCQLCQLKMHTGPFSGKQPPPLGLYFQWCPERALKVGL